MKKEVNIFHARTIEQTLAHLSTSSSGLSKEQARAKLAHYGRNIIPEAKPISPLLIFLKQFHSLFIYILLLAALISYFFSSLIDVYVISAVILINATIGFFQEYKAEKSIKALKKMLVDKAKVYRSNHLLQVPAKSLVPGDIILLEEGDRIPADSRLLEIKNFRTVESSLTGESLPTNKELFPLPLKTPLGDRKNMVWMGTYVASGTAKAIVTSTGSSTIIGTLALEISSMKEGKDHFKAKTDKLALFMGLLAALGASAVFLIGFFIRGFDFPEIFLFTIASLVSGIPEGLPAILAIVLAVGAFRMSRRKALIRNLYSTETLAVVDTIITDKTGTLTQNTMTIEKIILPFEKEIIVSGSGWEPKGEFHQEGKPLFPLEKPNLSKLLHIASICNKAALIKTASFSPRDRYKILGDPTEASLLVLAEKAGLKKSILLEKEKLLDEMPFNEELKHRASLISFSNNNRKEVYVIGAPESILQNSCFILEKSLPRKMTAQDESKIVSQINSLAKQALRVIAIAYSPISNQAKKLHEAEVKELIFLGIVGMKDPPRPEVAAAIQKARRAGIRVVMATGDHKDTALAVAKEIGLITGKKTSFPQALTEAELLDLEKLSRKSFEDAIKNVNVFARLSPEMKLKLASALQKLGAVVAMTGDGINDAPALKKADIGIAMGKIGTDVARASSDIVLANDNFASIVSAIEEGRIVFTNTRQTSTFLAITNFAEHVTIITALSIGSPLPLLPTQILFLNLVADTGTGIGLAVEPDYNHALHEPPRNSKENILTRKVIPLAVVISTIMALVTLSVFAFFISRGITEARTAAFAALSFTQLFNAFNMRSLKKSLFNIGLFTNKYFNFAVAGSILMILLVLYIPFLQSVFHFTTIKPIELFVIFLLSSSILWFGEIYKFLKRDSQV